MNCERFRLARIADEEAERLAARRHAAGCRRCAEVLRADDRLREAVQAWKRTAPEPPSRLEGRIAAKLAAEGLLATNTPTAAPVPSTRFPGWSWQWAAVAAAAVLLIAVTVIWRAGFGPAELGSHARAVNQAEQARQQYLVAIAQLERQAETVLVRAEDPALSSREAARLLNYRDRLTHLDAVIAEVAAFLDENPGHAGGHTVLLAAYKEKDELLQEILGLSIGGTS